ncbi:hypothetical protein ACM40_05760 [Chryseobacterium sp. BLS98]|uniref:ATP-binding cassette domain-containing protein n=1 Tax=Chryseobacterium sp. BLS98 TaxID=885586 RepID=UPI00065AE8DC|nr:ABC transporter ATP-binding protein [Chryseobacterium sp. BLS98]KMQ61834.1 hypothetical protein ACM40_05760 [Chryseobacterium sp. BLS98]
MITTVYIPKKSLEHLFDHTEIGTLLQLGGYNDYIFLEDENSIILSEIRQNVSFIQNFYGKDIDLVSAIVGKNGAGKSSIMRQFNYPIDQLSQGSLFVWEEIINGRVITKIINQTKKEIVAPENIEVVTNWDFLNILYYSPIIDFELKSARSPVNPSSKFDSSLQQYYLKSLHQQGLLMGSSLIPKIIESYPDFPNYKVLTLSAHNFTKDYFMETYVLSNFGNPNRGDTLVHELNRTIQTLETIPEETITRRKEDVINEYKDYLRYLKADSFTEKLKQIWDIPEYLPQDQSNKIHDQKNIIKDVEVLILSYLQAGAVFVQNGLGAPYNFDDFLKAENFEQRLDQLLTQYIIQKSDLLHDIFISNFGRVSLQNSDEIIKIIKEDKFHSFGSVEFAPVKRGIIKNVEDFTKIKKFYSFMTALYTEGESISFDFEKEYKTFSDFNELYKEIITILSRYNRGNEAVLFDFSPDKKLSNGEKVLLDLFSSFYSYVIENKRHKQICKEHLVLLLDEPELGYHPLWKKKFVLAITTVLPILFSELKPLKYNAALKNWESTGKDAPSLQIIFSTHDPLTLSDVLFENVIFLDKAEDQKTIISTSKKRTFGANVSDLFADSFFISDGLIGEFSDSKINKTIDWLRDENDKADQELHRILIEKIDEPIIQRKLAQMYSEKMKTDLAKKLLQIELEEIQNRLNKM